MEQRILDEIIRKHDLWLDDQEGGERANLSFADLSFANLRSADLSSADLRSADLRSADLRSANLSSADLSSADLRSANLSFADLSSANLSSADLSSADLRSADLRSANLSFADLRSADLDRTKYWSCRGNNTTIKTIHCDTYDIAYTDKVLQIGCEQHDIKDWWKFNDEKINRMDSKALSWWKIWKPIIRKIIKYSPAENNGFVEKQE